MMITMTITDRTRMAKPRKMIAGVLAIEKAGCVRKRIRKVMTKMAPNPAI